MKISVSLPDDDVAFLDRYAAERAHGSRSSVVHKAVRLLRSSELGAAYEDAWAEWQDDGHAGAWEPVAGDGMTQVRRGEVRLVDLNPVRDAEADKRRPAVIVSNDGANSTAQRLGRGVITVVPVTSNVARVYPFQVLLDATETGLPRDSKAQAEQVRSVAIERVGERVGRLTPVLLAALEEALRLHLAL